MLPKVSRLSKAPDFKKVKEEGKLLQSEDFGLAYFTRGDVLPSKFGFVVSTKISKKATERNRVKRMLRESVRKVISEVKPGVDILFLGKKSLLKTTFDKTTKEVRQSLVKANLLK